MDSDANAILAIQEPDVTKFVQVRNICYCDLASF